MSGTRQLNSAQRRVRREQVARRNKGRCVYCRRPFASLDEVTLDHVVPVSLLRTWSAAHLVAACAACNHAKADRLPLSLALLLVFTYGVQQPTASVHGSVHERSAVGGGEQSGGRVGGKLTDSPPVDWRLLARLAHAHHTVFTATWTGAESGDSTGARSMPDLHDNPRHTPRAAVRHPVTRRPHGRPDYLRTPRLVSACSRPTGEAVPA